MNDQPKMVHCSTTFASLMDEEEEKQKAEEAGLDLDDLESMDEDERREALEDAGLNPDDYDEF